MLENDVPSPKKFMPSIPKEIEEIIFKSTSKDLNIRYKDAKEMRKDIEKVYNNKKLINKGHSLFARIFGLSRD